MTSIIYASVSCLDHRDLINVNVGVLIFMTKQKYASLNDLDLYSRSRGFANVETLTTFL